MAASPGIAAAGDPPPAKPQQVQSQPGQSQPAQSQPGNSQIASAAAAVAPFKGERGQIQLQSPAVTSEMLAKAFERLDYKLDGVRESGEVPPLLLANLPRDLTDIRVASDRKAVFLKTALPLILWVNREIGHQRLRLHLLRVMENSGTKLGEEDRAWLELMRTRYAPADDSIEALLRRVDVIPPSLALSQAAEESGWGTSRFAREGNALFGQRIWRGDGGIIPHERRDGESYRVRCFDRLIEGVAAYAFNLNTHPAYKRFRAERAKMRAAGKRLDGRQLAGALTAYSERREAYVETIRTIMRANGLRAFDDARLSDRFRIIVASPDA